MPALRGSVRVALYMSPEERVSLTQQADAQHMTLPALIRKRVGLPRNPERRGRPKGSGVKKVRMVQAPLFVEPPPAPESSKRASDSAIAVAAPVDDERGTG